MDPDKQARRRQQHAHARQLRKLAEELIAELAQAAREGRLHEVIGPPRRPTATTTVYDAQDRLVSITHRFDE